MNNRSDWRAINIYYHENIHPELSGCITTLSVCNMEAANFCEAMDTLIDQDGKHTACLETLVYKKNAWLSSMALMTSQQNLFISATDHITLLFSYHTQRQTTSRNYSSGAGWLLHSHGSGHW